MGDPGPAFQWKRIDCPTCEVDDTRPIGWRGGWAHRDGTGEPCRIVECRRCGLLYANPFPTPVDLDAIYGAEDGYFRHHADPESKIGERAGLILRLEALLGGGGRLLDIGAGLGETVAAALRRGWDAWGVEPNSGFAADAKTRTDGRVVHGQVEDIPREIVERPFDAVVLAGVLEHLHEPDKVLGWLSRALRPGGVVFFDVPNEQGLHFRLANLYMRLRGLDWVSNLAPTFSPFHVFGFSKRSLTLALRKHGLAPEVWVFFGGQSLLPLQRSVRGLIEWTAAHAISRLSNIGEQGTYIECFSRKQS